METDNTGIVQATYTYGNGLISMNRAGTVSYYHYDGLGSTGQMTDSSEAVVASYTYDSFGSLIASSGTVVNAYGFTGEQQFGEADGLVFLRARYYDSKMARFISRDPIGYRKGPNLYTYARNNPINLTDPSGLWPWGPYPWGGPDWDLETCRAYCFTRAGIRPISNPGCAPFHSLQLDACLVHCGDQDLREDVDIHPNPDDNWDPWPNPVNPRPVSPPPPGVDDWLFFVCIFIILLICKAAVVMKKRFGATQ